jgi:hypothetical protein
MLSASLAEEIETAAENHFYQQMIGAMGHANSYAEVKLPVGIEIQIDGWHNLLLLLANGIEAGNGPVCGIVLKASHNLLGELIANLYPWLEVEPLRDSRPVKASVESGVERQIPWPELLVDDWADFQSPGIRRKNRPLIANLQRQADADRPFPFFRRANTGAKVIAYPLISLAVRPNAGEDVKAGLKPIVPALGDFDSFVLLIVRRIGAVGGCFAADGGEVAVQFDHGVAGRDGFGPVDLDLVVTLRERGHAEARE